MRKITFVLCLIAITLCSCDKSTSTIDSSNWKIQKCFSVDGVNVYRFKSKFIPSRWKYLSIGANSSIMQTELFGENDYRETYSQTIFVNSICDCGQLTEKDDLFCRHCGKALRGRK